jgi:hypothetical protein
MLKAWTTRADALSMDVRSRTVAVLAIAFIALTAAGIASAAGVTKRQAEVNVLHATRVLSRWHIGVADPATGALRSNTSVACSGRGQHGGARYRRFICIVRYQARTVRLLYTTGKGRGFRLRRLGTGN